jgi:hypothetical protein
MYGRKSFEGFNSLNVDTHLPEVHQTYFYHPDAKRYRQEIQL